MEEFLIAQPPYEHDHAAAFFEVQHAIRCYSWRNANRCGYLNSCFFLFDSISYKENRSSFEENVGPTQGSGLKIGQSRSMDYQVISIGHISDLICSGVESDRSL